MILDYEVDYPNYCSRQGVCKIRALYENKIEELTVLRSPCFLEMGQVHERRESNGMPDLSGGARGFNPTWGRVVRKTLAKWETPAKCDIIQLEEDFHLKGLI
ncbi:hypothetical protein CDAR_234071 [Caerostris darwini]|uniref:Uncharacterized protein n=1 Tax=Caerostris darwini TaxID=1538125 RepID=A0AAV4UEF1_9ARAC|nr:hypothetical protein CDAR_234071 [Caerostris darwini]